MASSVLPSTSSRTAAVACSSAVFSAGSCSLGKRPSTQSARSYAGVGFLPHADLHPGEVLAAQPGNNTLYAVVSPGAALTAHPGTTHIQTDVVKQSPAPDSGGIFIKIRRLGHCVAA